HLRNGGQRQCEAATAAGRFGQHQLALQQLGELTAQIETEARAAVAARRRLVELHETLEHAPAGRRRDARTVVAHREQTLVSDPHGPQLDRTFGRVLHRVLDEVDEDLVNLVRVRNEAGRTRLCRRAQALARLHFELMRYVREQAVDING